MIWDQALVDEIRAVPEHMFKIDNREIPVVDLQRDASPRVHMMFWADRSSRGLGALTMVGGGIYACDWAQWRDRVIREYETGLEGEPGMDWE